ncbi:MAG: DEAD/DEAH box helicase [Actinomycetota bacterium]|nr:DEAD/DEAH box helicase [Actinomycetota bacterium]
MSDPPGALERFSAATRAWFESAFAAPTPAQAGAWDAISSGRDALVVAPTGSGKTLAAFLWSLDRLAARASPGPMDPEGRRSSPITPSSPPDRLRVLYVSPLKALAVDIERNLRSPLSGITQAAARLGFTPPDITVGVRTGDTPANERRRFLSAPPDILITTPESLFLLLTSRARESLRAVDTVILDEIHSVAGTKRGSHLALSLERLDALLPRPAQRIALSATVRPVDEVARFVGGARTPVVVQAPTADKVYDLSVVVPVEDMTAPVGPELDELTGGSASGAVERSSVWPHLESRLLELVLEHRSTIVFANSRRLAERLCARLNELAEKQVARAHHGSVSREQRSLIEDDLKAGRLPAVVATSSLELGIDMSAVDLVVQVEAPDSVASGLQRVGRAGHQVGAVSRGVFFPKYRGDLLECAVVVERIKEGAIEELRYPRNPLDVLAQQIVAMVAVEDWDTAKLEELVRRAAPFADLPENAFRSVLDMLAGRYPSDEFAELRPRLNWDRSSGVLRSRPGAGRLAVTSGGTIPDRGLFGVFIAGAKQARVGELDEEMVYESRVGEVFMLGSSSWLIEDITPDRVVVTPAPGQSGKMPFWHGDAPGRPLELGRALGAFVGELAKLNPDGQRARLKRAGLDDLACTNLIGYLTEQRGATGVLPDDRTLVLERFRDELGDWRVCIHSPFGAKVHAPWAQAIEARLASTTGLEVQCIYTDDGIVVRLPEAEEAPPSSFALFDPEEIQDLVVEEVGRGPLFASRFRECAARSLLLPRRRPGSRTPLWQQRQRSAHLLQVASKYASFPVMLETYRECLQDVFDLPGLTAIMTDIRSRSIRVVEVETATPSPFASSLQFGYVSAFMYEGDAPLAERRAQALSLDRSLLSELLGHEELRDLLDPAALGEVELELQKLTDDRKARNADELHDLLRMIGDLSPGEIAARVDDPAAVQAWLEQLWGTRRAVELRIAGEARWVAIEDSGRFRDALGAALPVGIPQAFLDPVGDPLGDLVARYARTHGPFEVAEPALRMGLGQAVVAGALRGLELAGRVVEGEFRPGGMAREWIDAEVLRRLRRRSLAAWRREIEPVAPSRLAAFSLAWQGVGVSGRRGTGRGALLDILAKLQGTPIPASVLEQQVLASRMPGYLPAMLDELGASGEVLWAGAGAIGSGDGWVCVALADSAPLLIPAMPLSELSEEATGVRAALERGGALFFRGIADAVGPRDDNALLLALWELVWAGVVTNDTFAPLRGLTGARGRSTRHTHGRRPRPGFPLRGGPPEAAGRWSLMIAREESPTRRLHALGQQLLERYGVVTRGTVVAEGVAGGWAAVYPVLKALEEAGRCRRGYFVEGLGGAQFALPGAVDRMRAMGGTHDEPATQVLAATDPANPYGAALGWPPRDEEATGHRAGRKAGAVVVLVGGELAVYVERGGRTLLSYSEGPEVLRSAADALALAARDGLLGRLAVEKADGEAVFDTPFARALIEAGFRHTSKGLRVRA